MDILQDWICAVELLPNDLALRRYSWLLYETTKTQAAELHTLLVDDARNWLDHTKADIRLDVQRAKACIGLDMQQPQADNNLLDRELRQCVHLLLALQLVVRKCRQTHDNLDQNEPIRTFCIIVIERARRTTGRLMSQIRDYPACLYMGYLIAIFEPVWSASQILLDRLQQWKELGDHSRGAEFLASLANVVKEYLHVAQAFVPEEMD